MTKRQQDFRNWKSKENSHKLEIVRRGRRDDNDNSLQTTSCCFLPASPYLVHLHQHHASTSVFLLKNIVWQPLELAYSTAFVLQSLQRKIIILSLAGWRLKRGKKDSNTGISKLNLKFKSSWGPVFYYLKFAKCKDMMKIWKKFIETQRKFLVSMAYVFEKEKRKMVVFS